VIARVPDSDEARLVIADGLLERGDPRGEFIRLSIQLARVGLDAPEAPDLVRRHDRLLVEHGKRWVRPLGPDVHEPRFRRGFVESVAIPRAEWLTDALLDQEAIRDVTVLTVRDQQALADRSELARVRGIAVRKHGSRPQRTQPWSITSPNTETLESIDWFFAKPGPVTRRVVAQGHVDGARMLELLALPRLDELDVQSSQDADAFGVLATDPRAARLRFLGLRGRPELLDSPYLAPRRMRLDVDDKMLERVVAWPPFVAADELILNMGTCRVVEPLLATRARPSRLRLVAAPDRFAAILTSPFVERVTHLSLGWHDFRPDPTHLQRLVVLDAPTRSLAYATELLHSGDFPRLARVKTQALRAGHPLDRAPL
jgi:uncharacterized protein (TIGR02996 family)